MTEISVPKTIEIPNKPITCLLEDAARDFPNNIAIYFFGTTLTYRQFDTLVKKAMNVLRKLGVKEGDRVSIMAPNCPQGLIAYQAILRIGAVVVQTNPLYVEREIEEQFNDANVKVALVLNLFAPRVLSVFGKTKLEKVIVLKLEDFMPFPISWIFPLKLRIEGRHVSVKTNGAVLFWSALMGEASDKAEPADVKPENTALLQYTGGTTGTAKGVVLTHGNILANTLQVKSWCKEAQPGKEVFILALPTFHAFGMTAGMNWALSLAAEMVLVPKFDADTVMKLIEKRHGTLFPGVPAMYVAINNHPKASHRNISSIKYCVSGAAPLPGEVKSRFEKLTGGLIVEGYGLTEASPVTHCNPLTGEPRKGAIGLPLPNTECKIVKGDIAEDCATGETGELIVRGPQVMAGYHNKPEETAKTIKNGWLFTGDMGFMDADGFVYLMDRKKELIISGGCNVYPKEIEDILFTHPAVLEAAAIGMSDEYLGEKVVAVVVKKPGEQVSEEELIAFCKKNLAAFKAPKKIIFRESLPKTVIGKVLKRVLREELGK